MMIRPLQFCAKISLNHSAANLLKLKHLESNVFHIGRQFCIKTSALQKSQNAGISVDKNDILIYQGPLSSRMKLAKLFSLTSSMIGLAMQPMLYNKAMESGTGLALTAAGGVLLGFFTFVTPVLLHFITKKYVTHLFYNPNTEEFTAATLSIFLLPVLTTYKADDVTRPDLPTMFASFYVRGKPLFADPEGFTSLELYKKMMGYDKPVDMKLSKPIDDIGKPANLK